MQRKNYLLIPRQNNFKGTHKSGFAMIMAIIVIVIISTIMALSLSMTAETGKRTTDLYLYEQAVLYSKSAAELTLLEIAQNGCKDKHNFTIGGPGEIQYDANISMLYVYSGTVGACTNYFDIATDEQNGSVLMDISITLTDPSIATEPIRYFRRSIQKL